MSLTDNVYGNSLFLNSTENNLNFNGDGHKLTINHYNTQAGGFSGDVYHSSATLAGKNINFDGISSLSINTVIKNGGDSNGWPGAALLINGNSSIELLDTTDTTSNKVDINVTSENKAYRLLGVGLSGGNLTIKNASEFNINLNLNTDGVNKNGAISSGLGFISLSLDCADGNNQKGTSDSTILDAGDATVNVNVTRQKGSSSLAGISYQNSRSDKKLIKDATIIAKSLHVTVKDENLEKSSSVSGAYIHTTVPETKSITFNTKSTTFNITNKSGSALGLQFKKYQGSVIFTGNTSFDVTSTSTNKNDYAKGIELTADAAGSTVDFQQDAAIVAKGLESVRGIHLSNNSAINFGGNTSITASALEGANPEGSVLSIKNNSGGSIRMGVDAEGQLNGKTVEINGDIQNNKSSLTIGLSGSESTMTSQVTDTFAEGEDTPRMRLLMADNATWFAKGSSTIGTIEADNATINLSEAGSTVAINDLTVTDQGLNVFVNEVSKEPRVTVAAKSGDGRIAVTGSDTLNDSYGNVDDMIRDLSQVVQENGTGTEGTSLVDTVTAEEGKIRGEVTSTLGEDGQWQTTVQSNVSLEGYSALSSLAAVNWRHEMNDVTKRMGELRDSNGKVGAWARAYGSELEYGAQNVTSKNTSIQVGADYALTDEWKMGAAFSYTDGSMTFDRGDGDNQAYGLAIYGTWMAENGLFVDLIGKYSRLETEFTSNKLAGEFDNNGWSFSVEAGWQFKPVDEAFVEPQVELTYGRLEGDAFHGSNGVNIVQDDFDSLIGRAGVRAGFFFPEKKGTIYAKASVAHDFKGDMESFAYLDEPYTPTATLKDELGGTWYEFGLGANFNWSETTYAYVDLQRTTAGNVNEAWRWNIGVRHAF